MGEVMNKIIELSNNGFKLDEPNRWFTCDNFKIIKKGLFRQLKVGDIVNDIVEVKGKNDKMYVISFIVVSHNDKEGEVLVKSSLQNSVMSSCSASPSASSLPIVEGYSILEREGKCVKVSEEHLNPQFNANSLKPSVQDSIRYAQAVNLAFNSTNLNGFDSEDKWISFTFDRADKIFNEFNKRCLR